MASLKLPSQPRQAKGVFDREKREETVDEEK
jgi:hypothetical protein